MRTMLRRLARARVYVLILWVLCGLCACSLVDRNSFLARSTSFTQFTAGIRDIKKGATVAKEILLDSFQRFPTVVVAKKLAWLADILGDMPGVHNWQQAQARLENATLLGWMNEGILRHYSGDYTVALAHYDRLLAINPQNTEALYHKAVSFQYMGDIQQAANFYYDTIDLDPFHTRAILNLAALHQKYGSPSDAVSFYLKGVNVFSKLHKNRNTSDHEPAYFHPHHSMLLYNLGLAYMQINQLDKAFRTTKELLGKLHEIETYLKEAAAQGKGKVKSPYNAWEITQSIGGALGSLSKIQRAALNWADWEVLHHQLVVYTLRGIEHAREHYCDGLGVEEDCKISYYGENRRKIPFLGPLLPFDTLMQPMSMADRLKIAIATSLSYKAIPYIDTGGDGLSGVVRHKDEPKRKLRLGFISYDFNDHPTAHLITAIFEILATQSQCAINILEATEKNGSYNSSFCSGKGLFSDVELFVFSYGRNDDSRYRKCLENLAQKFIDIAGLSFSDSAALLRSESIDILLDLQIHTLGSRLEITASGVAPTVVNYLVFPGTSGALFYDYLAVDEVVVPAEHAQYYSESLLMLPPTYQISSYEEYVPPEEDVLPLSEKRKALRKRYGLPEDPNIVVFCNFNKINKIDPESFALWIQVLLLVPNGYLWLLEPSDGEATDENGSVGALSKESLLRSAVAAGISQRKIIFAARTKKPAHIYRHAAADLFLDTVVYGAHSTATDALRGGIPVLTLLGESFPSRVAPSLYASFSLSPNSNQTIKSINHNDRILERLMVVDSAKDFVDTAARISRRWRAPALVTTPSQSCVHHNCGVSNTLTHRIDRIISDKAGLFNATRNVELFVRSMEGVEEVRAAQASFSRTHSKRFHVIIR